MTVNYYYYYAICASFNLFLHIVVVSTDIRLREIVVR